MFPSLLFYITFGQASPLKDGYILVQAPDELFARRYASQYPYWCGCYTEDNFEPILFPAGQLGDTVVLGTDYEL